MKLEDLKIGPLYRYKLTRDVVNPKPDKRTAKLSGLSIWPKGLELKCAWTWNMEKTSEKFITGLCRPGFYEHGAYVVPRWAPTGSGRDVNPAFLALLEALEPVLPSAKQQLKAAFERAGIAWDASEEVLARMMFDAPAEVGASFLEQLSKHFDETCRGVVARDEKEST